MTSPSTHDAPAIPGEIVDEAIGWLVATREGLTEQETIQFRMWFDGDARHRMAWQHLGASLDPFRVVESQNVSGRALVSVLARQRMTRRTALAHGTMAVGTLGMSLGIADRMAPLGSLFADYRTATGQRRAFTLPDGSALTLDARSEADRVDGRRSIVLGSGTAFVATPERSDPFVIDAGGGHVLLNGGSVVVSRRPDRHLRVICTQGRARVDLSDGVGAWASAGTGYEIADGRLHALAERETRDAASWLEGKLILHDRSLGAMIDAYRPYRAGVLSISPAAARLPVSGVFELNRLEEALLSLSGLFSITILRIGSLFTRIDIATPAE